jgi:hypothetical protein
VACLNTDVAFQHSPSVPCLIGLRYRYYYGAYEADEVLVHGSLMGREVELSFVKADIHCVWVPLL